MSSKHVLISVPESCLAVCLVLVASLKTASAQVEYEREPINYSRATPQNPVEELIVQLARGELQLEFDDRHGWLPSLLEELEIPVSSQTLVFSKTSLQLHKISPRTPRALYFNDDVYVGWCQRGDVIEIATADAQLGAVFYNLDQNDDQQPTIRRDRGNCLTCHASYRTQGVPGFLVRSIYSDANGRPRTGTRTFVTDHTTEFQKRFGGWYVSGSHGGMRHMGNVIARDRLDPEQIDREVGSNLESLADLCDTEPYLAEHSDLIALMVLEHQSQMHNFISRASIETRIARHYDQGINEALGRPRDTVSPSTKRRIETACENLVQYMLFADEMPLDGPLQGSSSFAEDFAKLGPRDERGRSLRDFDLKTRMFRYPCSFLIYSESFECLPSMAAERTRQKLQNVLLADEAVEGYEHLTAEDRRAIVEILDTTKPGYLREASGR